MSYLGGRELSLIADSALVAAAATVSSIDKEEMGE